MQQERGHPCAFVRDWSLRPPPEPVPNRQNNALKVEGRLEREVFAELGCCQSLAAHAGMHARAPIEQSPFGVNEVQGGLAAAVDLPEVGNQEVMQVPVDLRVLGFTGFQSG